MARFSTPMDNASTDPDVTETEAGDESLEGESTFRRSSRAPIPSEIAAARYSVLDEAGRGGIGRVVRARDNNLEREIAIKELLRPGATAEARFLREAKLTARLQHPGIVPIYETGRWPNGEPFYAMKMVAGKSLKELIAESATLEERLGLLPNVLAVADAIAYAHSKGIIHRDLKPSNIIVGEFGETVVIDWGLARELGDDSGEVIDTPFRTANNASLTTTGAVVGTPAYMSPEQAEGSSVDERSDVYSLAGVLFTVLTGKAPVEGASSAEILAQVASYGGAPSSELMANSPSELRAIVQKAMAREPSDRYRSAYEFSEDLRSFQNGARVGAHKYTLLGIFGHWLRTHRTLAVTASIATLLVLVSVVVGFVRLLDEKQKTVEQRRQTIEAKQLVEQERDSLVLGRAVSALESDPTEALAWTKRYPKTSEHKPTEVVAEALRRGVARDVLRLGNVLKTAAFSPDGEHAVVLDESSGLFVVHVGDGHIVATLERGGFAYPEFVDESRILWADQTGRVILWHWTLGKSTTLAEHGAGVYDVALSADGRRVASVGLSRSLRVATIDGKELVNKPLEETGAAVAFVGDSIVVGTIGGDLFRLVPAGTSDLVRIVGGLGFFTSFAQLDDSRIAVGTGSGSVMVFGARGGALLDFDLNSAVAALASDASGKWLAAGTVEGQLTIWELPTRHSYRVKAQSARILDIVIAANLVIWGDSLGTVRTVSLTNRNGLIELVGHRAAVSGVTTNSGAKRILSVSADGSARIWAMPALQPVATQWTTGIYNLRTSSNGRWLAADSDSGDVALYDTTMKRRTMLRGHKGVVYGLTFSADESRLASVSWDHTVREWDLESQTAIETHVLESAARDAVYVSDGSQLAMIDSVSEIRLTNEFLEPRRFPGAGKDGPHRLAFGHANRAIWLGGADGILWEQQLIDGERQEHARFDGSIAWIERRADSVFVGTRQGVVSAWGVNDSRQRWMYSASSGISSFAASDATVAVGTELGRVFVLSATDGRLQTVVHHRQRVGALGFDALGRFLASGDDAGKVFLTDLEHERISCPLHIGRQVSAITFAHGILYAATLEGEVTEMPLLGEESPLWVSDYLSAAQQGTNAHVETAPGDPGAVQLGNTN